MEFVVKPLKQKDAGRGLAVIDTTAAEELGLESDDFVRIKGDAGTATARVQPGYPEDQESGIIRVDGQIRKKIGVGIDDHVEVEKADVNPAKSITVALPQQLDIRGNIDSLLQDQLDGKPVTKGKTVQLPVGFGLTLPQREPLSLEIANTDPTGTVVIHDSTEFHISEKSSRNMGDRAHEVCVGEHIELGGHYLNKDRTPKVKGTIRTTVEETIPEVVVRVWFYEDREGKQHIAYRSTSTRNLKSGKEWSFEISLLRSLSEKDPESYDITVTTDS